MTISAIITAARKSIAELTIVPQPMASHDHAERMVRKDALAILDEMAAQIATEAPWSQISDQRIADLADGLSAMSLYPDKNAEAQAVSQPDAVDVALTEIRRLQAELARAQCEMDYILEAQRDD